MTIYMKIEGIEGDVSTKGYEKWIEIEEIDWNLSRSIRSKPGLIADREATKPAISDLIIKKIVDRTTPHTLCEACVGKAKSIVKIHFCQTGDTLSSYMEFTLNNVLFSNYSFKAVKGAEDAHSTMETISMNFDKVEVKYIPYDATHRPGSPILTGYDLATATKI